ncbi:prepilin-type N-terminal cleavage/methylation domain-containing protein [Pseudoluteimonas lycopersici]|uniref:Prepilin-type N-terminal cleavage/methylation domain-containing protein n=1 Tax=Pseudoluteimonas lycopersici TaxID=1324796 RepID=A0A516V7G3_9GAMM|nr:prepilin-type N-terminal cleavage/methylation domain-containing protein [Lysobacter lycopersici]QDQ74467.1 prepilin-type N-terminal cleavage/methylation domain-containing protein [Lysobacter lycopersici]
MNARRARGFTLIEVILATVLLASGLALAFASLRAASATATRGEQIAHRDERMRAVSNFLRRRLSSARSIAFALDAASGQQLRFSGDGEQMRFVADLPDYLGRGGPYVHTLHVVRNGDSSERIEVDLAMALGGQTIAESPPRPPDVLVDGLGNVRFRYRGMNADGQLGGWSDTWDTPEALPLQVSIDLADKNGRAWPGLIIALQLAGSEGGGNGLGAPDRL